MKKYLKNNKIIDKITLKELRDLIWFVVVLVVVMVVFRLSLSETSRDLDRERERDLDLEFMCRLLLLVEDVE